MTIDAVARCVFWACLGADIWSVVGVTQLGGDVEPELLTVLYCSISQPDAQGPTLCNTRGTSAEAFATGTEKKDTHRSNKVMKGGHGPTAS